LLDMMVDENWDIADDDVVSSAMRSLSKWQEQWNIIERSYRKYENMSIKHNFPEHRKEAVKATYEENKEKFESVKEALNKQDSDRGLLTLEPARTDIIKYPTISGSPSEDYLKFKETMEI
jgi:hypothetical protein